eukprot:TRINITY_DN10094_c0_g4_i1.p1 TRINITY_DN10094_c0_g4~~TRINITY_DN10094_c0_g4_i1.p1  ORF type:complete len:344 (-),score=55.88 TRINITY_DN10094_c0_g4_i1:287-1249(-)
MAAQWEVELERGSSDESDYSSEACSSSDGEGSSWGVSAKQGLVALTGLAVVGCLVYMGPSVLGMSAPAQPHASSAAREDLAVSPGSMVPVMGGSPAMVEALPSNSGVPTVLAATSTTMRPVDARFPPPEAPAPLVTQVEAVPQQSQNKRRWPTEKPQEHMHDGNLCDDTEELYDGLCYTKCSILIGTPMAHRATAFSCCPTSDCHGNVLKMKTASLVPCQGYDVSSSDGGIACPHIRGECLTDEEQFMGECFEKCSMLTNGKFPKRIAAATCCNPEGDGGCFNFHNDDTNAKLNVGGGAGDHDASTPRGSHFPLKYLTEK